MPDGCLTLDIAVGVNAVPAVGVAVFLAAGIVVGLTTVAVGVSAGLFCTL